VSDTSTSALLEEARAYYKALLRPVFKGRRFVLPGNIAVGLGNVALDLCGLGAARPFVVAGSHGTGPLPPREDAELRVLDVRGTDPLEHNRNVQRALADLPSAVRDAVDAWDPDGWARTLHTDPLAEPRPVAGRAAYAARSSAWTGLEDKVVIDAFWDTVGVPRAPSQVVPARHKALRTAANALDRGHGTVWAAGVSTLAGALGDFPLILLCLAIAEGEELDYRPELLEQAAVEAADANRVCGGGRTTERTLTDTGTYDLVRAGDDYREAEPGEEPEATLLFGPGPIGGFLRFTLNPAANEPGPPSAPQAARAFRLADRLLGTEFGDLEAAWNVRP